MKQVNLAWQAVKLVAIGLGIGIIIVLFLGCASLTGDFPLSASENGTVDWKVIVQGNPDHEFVGVGALPFSDGGPRWLIGMRDLIVRNRTSGDIRIDVQCSDGGFANRPVRRGREQWFMGRCALKAWRAE